MSMDNSELHGENRQAWNAAAAAYEKAVEDDIEFLRKGGKNFCPPESQFLSDLKSWCRRAIHLQCAGGTDTLSLWNQGADEVVGIDISERMIACAERKSDALGAPAQWFACDVLDTPSELDGTADLVYTGRGALCWIMDYDSWASTVARLLKPGGRLYIYEGHPMTWLWDQGADHLRLDPEYGDYFFKEVLSTDDWPETYITEDDVDNAPQPPKHEVHRNVGQLINPVIAAGLRLVQVEEHPDEFYDSFPQMPKEIKSKLPHTISLLFEKPHL